MRRTSLAIAFGWLATHSAPPAYADHASYHLTANGDVAATDNVFGASASNRQADLFFQIRPGVLFAYDAPRMIHDINAEVEFLEYTRHSDIPSVTYRLGWRALFLPGPRSDLIMTANASTGLLTALNASTPANETVVSVIPAGAIDVRQGDASENLSLISSKDTRVTQNIVGRYAHTDDHVGNVITSAEVGPALGFEQTFRNNSFAIEVGGSYLRLERIAPVGAIQGNRLDQQLNPRGYLQWRHDINKQWSANADGGVVLVYPVGKDPYNPMDTNRKGGTFPVAGLQVAYAEPWGRVTMSARRQVSPNLFIAQNTVTTGVTAQLALPLPWLSDSRRRDPKLFALSTLGVENTQLINSDTGGTNGNFYNARVDVSLGWSPKPGQTYGVRYEFAHQTGDDMATMLISPFTRNTLYFTFALRYPDRIAGQVPKTTKTVRSDRKDLTPVGAEPVVPDILDSQQQGDEPDER